jgi:hypothetical protein
MFTNKLIFIVSCFLLAAVYCILLYAQNVSLQPLVTNLDNPKSIANAGEGTGRLFITEQDGTRYY